MSAPTLVLRDDAARQVLRGFARAGVEIVGRARSPHGSDCSSSCEDGSNRTIGQCRCMRVMRLRVKRTDWLLVFGDRVESMGAVTVRLQGPYEASVPLAYGGGFWNKVEV